MCGIFGFFSGNRKITAREIHATLKALRHRGPDNSAVVCFDSPDSGFKIQDSKFKIQNSKFRIAFAGRMVLRFRPYAFKHHRPLRGGKPAYVQ